VNGCVQTDAAYLTKVYAEFQATQKMQNCKSGSCANVVMTFNDDLYVINVGDSRAIGSKNNGAVALDLS
jgi:serine/threonine protein phosphatase PrpC